MELLVLVVGLLVGITIGVFLNMRRMRKSIEDASVGYLRIDRSEPDEPPRPFLEVKDATIESISRKKFVMLKVINENYISQK